MRQIDHRGNLIIHQKGNKYLMSVNDMPGPILSTEHVIEN